MRFLTAALLCIAECCQVFAAGNGHKKVGTVHATNTSSREIVIATRAGSIQMGQKIFALVGGKPVLMVSTFPMMTKTNARLLPGYGKYLIDLKKGTDVYAYVKGIESQRDEEVIKKSGSVSELAMLCGKPIDSENVKAYLRQLGPDFEKRRIEQWLYYSYKKSGISVSFRVTPSETRLSRIFLYNEGADKFNAYRLELPEKLRFTDTRAKVEEKLGAPAEVKKYYTDLGMLYPVFGLQINYDTLSPDDMNARIHHIVVGNPDIKD